MLYSFFFHISTPHILKLLYDINSNLSIDFQKDFGPGVEALPRSEAPKWGV